MSGEKLYIWKCSECGGQVGDASTGHSHDDTYPPAEKVEVVPVARLEEVEEQLAERQRECEQARGEIANYVNSTHADEQAYFKLRDERDRIAERSVSALTELTDRWEGVAERERVEHETFKERLTSPDDWRDISGAASLRCPEPTPCPKCIVEAAIDTASERGGGDA